MRARVSLCLLLLMAVVRAIAQGTAGSSLSDAPQFVRSLHDPTDLTGKILARTACERGQKCGARPAGSSWAPGRYQLLVNMVRTLHDGSHRHREAGRQRVDYPCSH